MNYKFLSLARDGELQYKLLCAAVFFISIKLSLAYLFILPFLLIQLLQWKKAGIKFNPKDNHLWLPLFLFAVSLIFSAIFSQDVLRSFKGLGTLVALIFFPLAVSSQLKDRSPMLLIQIFLFGQVVAAFESIINSLFTGGHSQIFLGAVTESGQLAMSCVLAVGLALQWIKRESDFSLEMKKKLIARGAALFLLLVFTAFTSLKTFSIVNYLVIGFLIITAIYKIVSCFNRGEKTVTWGVALITFISPILFSTLCINLKRGPWIGVIVALSVLLYLYSRKLLLFFLFGVATVFATSAPLNDRLMQSIQHFEMSGGRATIWQIGKELVGKYPLGVGWDNARFFQRFSAEVPAELTHFHNNFINIMIEGGAVALSLFIWWLVVMFRFSFFAKLKSEQILLRSLGAALLSWQVAGFVEYNFGDTEVLLVALLFAGIIESIYRKEQH